MWWSILTLTLALTAPAEDAHIIRLKVGAEVVGTILEFQEATGVRVQRVDDGAVLNLRWDQMLPEDVRRIRASRGFLPDEPEPIYVEATKVTLTTGMELIGVIVDQDEETFTLRQQEREWQLRWKGVRYKETVQVDVLQVYDAEQYYQELVYQAPQQTALDHYNLALMCESLQLWSYAQGHLAQVQEIDAAFKSATVRDKLTRCELRLEAGEEAAVLAQAARFANRELYDQAAAVLESFLAQRPNSRLRGEAQRDLDRILSQRQDWVRGKVIANFFSHLDRFAARLARDKEIEVQEARNQMELEATLATLNAVARQLGAGLDEVQAVWEDENRPRAAPRMASYSAGTFTLGQELVFEGVSNQDVEDATGDGDQGPAAGDSLEDRIKKILEDRRRQQEEKAKKGPKEAPQFQIQNVPPTQEEWWAAANVAERKGYLVAFWVDRDPNVRLIKVLMRSCARCSGEGVLRYFSRADSSGVAACPRCKSLRVDRVVRYQ